MSPVPLLLEANGKAVAKFGEGRAWQCGPGLAQQPWPSLAGLCPFLSCKPNGEAHLPSPSTSAHSESGLESWGFVCLSLLLGPKNRKWEIHLCSDEKYYCTQNEMFRFGVERLFSKLN